MLLLLLRTGSSDMRMKPKDAVVITFFARTTCSPEGGRLATRWLRDTGTRATGVLVVNLVSCGKHMKEIVNQEI